MTRAAAARAIAKTPYGVAIPRETVMAALAGIAGCAVLPDSERRYEDSVCVEIEGIPVAPTWRVRFEFDVANATMPRPGAIALGAFHDGHAYRLRAFPITAHRGILYGVRANQTGGSNRWHRLEGDNGGARIVGCAVREWWTGEDDGREHGIECPQGVPWTNEYRMPGFEEARHHSARRLGEAAATRAVEIHAEGVSLARGFEMKVDARGVRL